MLLNARSLALSGLGLVEPEPVTSGIGLGEFAQLMFPDYYQAPHLRLLDTYLERVALYSETSGEEGLQMLLSAMPPQHGKSLKLARLFPAWYLGRNPDKRVIVISWGAGLCVKHSRYVRDLMMTQQYRDLFGVTVAHDSASAMSWDIEGRLGGMDVAGVGGGITGNTAHLLICDDLIKDRAEAESTLIRDKTWDAFTDNLFTRFAGKGAGVILNATRWHEDDPTGRVLDRFDTVLIDYEYLRLPALADEVDDPIGRALGEPLWPEQHPLKMLDMQRSIRTIYSWSSMYQQRPSPPEGGAWKQAWIHTRPSGGMHDFKRIVVGVDPAASAEAGSSETGIIVAGLNENGMIWILDDFSVTGSPDEWARAVVRAYEAWQANTVVAEINQGGDMVRHTLRTVKKALPIRTVRATRGKVIRAEPVMAWYEQGKVWHGRDFPELEHQMLTWQPGEPSPDRMDAMVWAVLALMPGSQPATARVRNLYGPSRAARPDGSSARQSGRRRRRRRS